MLNLRDIFTTGRLKDSAFVGIHLGTNLQNDGVNFSRKVAVVNVVTNPAAAETIVVGYSTYTFRVTPTLAGEIEIGNLIHNGSFANGNDGSFGGRNWTVDATGALHTAGVPVADNTFVQPLIQVVNPKIIAGKTYTVTFTITGWSAGTVTVSIGGVAGTARGSSATFAEAIVATSNGELTFTPTATFDGKLSAILVTEPTADLKGRTALNIAAAINADSVQARCTAYTGYDKVGLTTEILLVANEIGVTPTLTPDGAKVVDAIAFTLSLTEAQLETVSYFKKNITSELDVVPTVLVERNAGTDKNFLY